MTYGKSDVMTSTPQFEKELVTHIPALRAFAISLCKKSSLAEDLAQDTLTRALAYKSRFTLGTSMKSWLFTICRNQFYSHMRKGKWERGWEDGFDNSLLVSSGLEVGQSEMSYDFRQHLLFLACLPPQQRDTLIAIGYLGMSYEDAADRFGSTVGTIKSRTNRAREALSDKIANARIVQVDIQPLQTATERVPTSHPLYPIAQAYEELYAGLESRQKEDVVITEDQAWEELLASGALEDIEPDLYQLMSEDLD